MINSNEIETQKNSPKSYDQTSSRNRGKHKIFIGMSPGVGKTYRMLEEGHQLKAEGIDVVIGLLETHRREETEAKAISLEVIPKKTIFHQGITLWEMDTDAILSRQPQLVLVDELAHTNVPGSIREKRYQDVEIILNHGINVYSTVNIQHLESLGEFLRVKSYNVSEAIAQISHQYHITQVVLGHTRKSPWELFWKRSPVQQLLKHLKGVDIHIIDAEKMLNLPS